MWGSGESEDDVMKKALASYEEDHKKMIHLRIGIVGKFFPRN
jgi:hypothetical protein